MSSSAVNARIRFDDFEADLHTQELHRAGRRVRLPNQSFMVLAALLENAGQLVSRDDLRKRLWPRDSHIDYDQALNAAVNRLREALRDSADTPRYVETLPRRGYRFVATVKCVEPEPAPAPVVERTTGGTETLWPAWPVALGVCAILGLAVFFIRSGSRPAAHEPALMPLTSLPGREIAPSFSPDGNQIVFAWDGEANAANGFDLYIKAIDSEKMLRLTQTPARWLRAAWSHDGRRIAFARSTGSDSGLFVIPALGGAEQRLASASFAEDAYTQLAWSAKDDALLYSAFDPSGRQTLYRLQLSTLDSQLLQPPVDCWDMSSVAFSPDGTRIAFICTTSFAVYSIYTATPAGTDAQKITEVKGHPQGLVWLRDGTSVVFANDAGDGGGLWRVASDRSVSRFAFGESASTPALTIGGARLAYVRGHRVIDIWRLELESASAAQATTRLISSTRQQMMPQYSPDGRHIAFQSNRSGSSEIWIADADGENPARITSFGGPPTGAPSWCSDGRRVAFDSRTSGSSSLYVVDIGERLPRKVATTATNLALPAWSTDCRWLIASDGNTAAYLVPVDGGPAQRFTDQPSYYASVSGDRVVFNVKERTGVTLWKKRIGETTAQPLAGMPQLAYTDSWVAGLRGVYFTLAADDPLLVRFYDFATRSILPVGRLEKPLPPQGGLGLSISADGRYLLYTQIADEQSDLMMIEGL